MNVLIGPPISAPSPPKQLETANFRTARSEATAFGDIGWLVRAL